METPDDGQAPRADELREHYEFDYGRAKPNRFADRFSEGAIVLVLDRDVAEAFPDSESVNAALRLLVEVAGRSAGRVPARSGA